MTRIWIGLAVQAALITVQFPLYITGWLPGWYDIPLFSALPVYYTVLYIRMLWKDKA